MRSAGCILWGLAAALLILAAFKSWLIWVAAFLLGVALAASLLRLILYRPPENHLGVKYTWGRLSEMVSPDQWTLVIPGIHEIKEPISLHLRRTEASLRDLLTEDGIPVDLELLAYYQLDLRLADVQFQSQALRIPDEGWNSIVRTVLQEVAGEVVGDANFNDLLNPAGRGRLKGTLSALLAERLRGLGMVINPQRGVSVQVVRPAGMIWQAMLDKLAATSLGEAAVSRVLPMLDELAQRHPEVAWEALLLEWAAAVTKEGGVPHVMIVPNGRAARDVSSAAALQADPEGRNGQDPPGRRLSFSPLVPTLIMGGGS